MKKFDALSIPSDEISPLVEQLLHIIQEQQKEIDKLKEEIAKLKGEKGKPKIKPSSLEKPKRNRDQSQKRQHKKSSLGRKLKTKETRDIEPKFIPEGSRFKGYKLFTVQEISVEAKEITFRMATYTTPKGELIRGELPEEYSYGHFGPELLAHCLQLYHGGFMTQPALLEYLLEQGIDISTGQLNNILALKTKDFSEEMDTVFEAGLKESQHLNVDDTGSRHDGKNGTCTCVSSPLFCYFHSSDSKSRLNFLEILRGSHKDYILDEEALLYAFERGISASTLNKLDSILDEVEKKKFYSPKSWEKFLKKMKIKGQKDIRILTEAAVLSSAIYHGLPEGLPIVTDAAPQFFLWSSHALCWIHEERHYRKFIPVSEREQEELDKIRGQIWDLYENLKVYSDNPIESKRLEIKSSFESFFNRSGVSSGLDELLKHTYSRKNGLLQVLDNPGIPLHNNDCERDIREYVKRRKISGTTRSAEGKKARDTFLSLKKTCFKLGVSFFGYIRDRVYNSKKIPSLTTILFSEARAGP